MECDVKVKQLKFSIKILDINIFLYATFKNILKTFIYLNYITIYLLSISSGNHYS